MPATVISCSLDRYVHNGWSMDHQSLAPADLDIAADPDMFTSALLDQLGSSFASDVQWDDPIDASFPEFADPNPDDQRIGLRTLALAVNEACAGRDACFIRVPLGMWGGYFTFRHPLDYLGSDGGGGIGAGPGMTIGAALALRDSGRLPIAILGDGDFLMASSAIWTAVAEHIPLLIVIANNHSFFNDEVHQERVARTRQRPVERKWIGQRIDDPAPNIAAIARDHGAIGIGPIERRDQLGATLADAISRVDAGGVCVVDVRVIAGYDVGVAGGLAGGTVERSK